MTDRVFNFAAGPATLPLSVLEHAQRELVALPGIGASPLEVSHRSPWFEGVIGEAEDEPPFAARYPRIASRPVLPGRGIDAVLDGPDEPAPRRGGEAAYVVTGSWGVEGI